MAAEGLPIENHGQFDYVRVGGASMLFVGEFDQSLGALVLETFDPAHLPLGVLPYGLGDVDVLALDDHPHGLTSETSRASRPTCADSFANRYWTATMRQV